MSYGVLTIEEIWRITDQGQIFQEISEYKWSCIGHALRKSSIEKEVLDWNPRVEEEGRLKGSWGITADEELKNQQNLERSKTAEHEDSHGDALLMLCVAMECF